MPPARRVLAVLIASLLCALVPSVASAETFTQRFSKNDSGDIAIIGNTLLTCPAAQTNASNISCAAAKAATSGGAGLADNDFDMGYYTSDTTTAGVFDSSSSTLALPDGATVLFAGLYWGARTNAGANGQDAPDPTAKNTVKLKVPGGAYTTYTADTGWSISGDTAYQQYKNVTAAVKAAGSGTYTVANVQAATGQDRYAGWSLVVAYQDLNAPPHNLSVFDGLTVVSQSAPTANIDVSGFTTAPSGDVKTTLGAIAYEGDMGKTGDGMTLEGHAIGDAASPANDLFNSSISVLGSRVLTGRDPTQKNNLGFDADLFNADGYLANSASTARLTVNTAPTNGETIFPGVLTFSSELLAARFRPTTTLTDVNGGGAEPGDEIEVATDATNTGNGAAVGVRVESDIPQGLEIVPGSLQLLDDAGRPVGSPDAVSYDPATRAITWHAGTSATSTAGGRVPVGGHVHIRYRVRVGTPADGAALPVGTVISYDTEGTTDRYDVTGTGGDSLTASTPDLSMDVTRDGEVVRGGEMHYMLSVRNTGSAAAHGLTRVTDQLPAGVVAAGTPAGAGWDCAVVDGLVTCDRTDDLGASAYPDISVPVRVTQSASSAIANTATVSNAGDGNLANNSDSDTSATAPAARAALSLQIAADPTTIAPGETTTVTATVTNRGPSDATGVQASLALPGGLELVSAQTGGLDCVATLCAVGTVPAGRTGAAVYVVRATRAAAGSTQGLTATSSAGAPDATTGDDTASTQIVVREQRAVSVTQTVSPDPLVAGDAATIHLGAHNRGPSTATGVVLTEPLPAQLRDVNAEIDAAAGTCAIRAGGLRCDLAPLADGGSAAVTVHAKVATDAADAALDLTATVAAVDGDPDRSDDTVTVHRTVAGEADLSLTAVDAPATLRAGEHGTWVLRATNGGHGDATGTAVRFALPTGVRLADAAGAACSTLAGIATCAIGALAAAAHQDVAIVVTADAGAPAGGFTLAADLSGDQPDPDSADAALAIPGTLAREADLAVTQTGPADVVAGTGAAYTATVTNTGPGTATGVVVTMAVPGGLTGATASVQGGHGTCSLAAGTITCRVGGLAVGERAIVDIAGVVARDAGGQAFDAVVRARGDETDADAGDNVATQRTGATAVSDVSVNAFAPAGIVAAGAQATVTLSAHNDGPSDADDVVLTTTLPAAAQPVDLDPRCALAGRTVTCRLGTIAVGTDGPVTITVQAIRAFPGALLGAGAGVSTSGRDPQPANDSLAQVADQPIRCTSHRQFTIRLRVPAASRLETVSVTVAGTPVRVRVGHRLTAVVDLRTRPAGRIVVAIRAVTRGGRQIVGTRAYQTCKVKQPTVKPPRI